jgi:hypothetical protein
MKRTLSCLVIITILGTCFATTAMAAPDITGVRGGYGVTATVVDADGWDWEIEIAGAHIFQGGLTEGPISGNWENKCNRIINFHHPARCRGTNCFYARTICFVHAIKHTVYSYHYIIDTLEGCQISF